MRVLVVGASKYGSTREIADAIGGVLRDRGLDVDVLTIEEVDDVAAYGAVVLGSAVYAGRWLKTARELVDRLAPSLGDRRVWLFSSGPVGDPPKPEEDPVDVKELQERTQAVDHRVFAGKLVKKQLSFGEKAIAMALRAPDGDSRDWPAIRQWASEIADALI